MKIKVPILFLIAALVLLSTDVRAQYIKRDTTYRFSMGRVLPIVGEEIALNAAANLIARQLPVFDFVKVTPETWVNNFKNPPVWDSDPHMVNFFLHPICGAWYYETARLNGASILASSIYTTFGSLCWEYLGEIDPPAINDLLCTTVGGVILGETFYNTFWNFKEGKPMSKFVSAGLSLQSMNDGGGKTAFSLHAGVSTDAFELAGGFPYEAYDLSFAFSAAPRSLCIDNVMARACMWSASIGGNDSWQALVGLYHPYYYNEIRIPARDGTQQPAFNISECVAFGAGFSARYSRPGMRIDGKLFADVIALGTCRSDHFYVSKSFVSQLDVFLSGRDYNIGPGYAIHAEMPARFWNGLLNLGVNLDAYRLFCLGEALDEEAAKKQNSTGNESRSSVIIAKPYLNLRLWGNLYASVSFSSYYRHTDYALYPGADSLFSEWRFGLTALFD